MPNTIKKPVLITCKLTLLLTVILLTGCASGPKIYANQDPAADFSQYKTYGYAKLDTDNDRYGSLLSQYMKEAASRELEARGYRKSDDPDLVVNFHVHSQEKIKTTQTPTSGMSYYGYRGYGGWGGYGGYETQVTQYTEGTVNVDLVDNKRSQLVWEVAVVGRVTEKARKNLKAAVNALMVEVFLYYPYIAGSNEVQPPPEDK